MKAPLLVLSLVANAILLAGVTYLALTPRTHQTSEPPKKSGDLDLPKAASPSQSQSPGLATVPAPTTPTPGTWQSPADIQAWLLLSGAPLKVRYAVAQTMLGEKYRIASEAVRFPPGFKKWQRTYKRPTPEQIEQLAALRLQQQEEMQQVLGTDYAKARFGEDTETQSGIPAEKWVEIERVTRDYMETTQKLGLNQKPSERQLLEGEMRTDLGKILTPTEFELHQAYESRDAHQLQGWLTGLDIDDETYLRAFRATTEFKARAQQPGDARNLRLEEIRAIEKAVGPEIAAHITLNQDATYREIGTLYAAANLPSVALLEKYTLWNQFHQNLPNAAPGQLDEAQKAVVRSYYDRLTEGLSATARAKFDRTRTGAFMGRLLAKSDIRFTLPQSEAPHN